MPHIRLCRGSAPRCQGARRRRPWWGRCVMWMAPLATAIALGVCRLQRARSWGRGARSVRREKDRLQVTVWIDIDRAFADGASIGEDKFIAVAMQKLITVIVNDSPAGRDDEEAVRALCPATNPSRHLHRKTLRAPRQPLMVTCRSHGRLR